MAQIATDYYSQLHVIELYFWLYQMNASQLIDNRSTLLIFRDCLKLAARMVDDPIKCRAVRQLIKR